MWLFLLGKPYQEIIVATVSLKSSPRIFGRAKFSLEITRLTNVPSKLIRECSEGSEQYSRAENSRKFLFRRYFVGNLVKSIVICLHNLYTTMNI